MQTNPAFAPFFVTPETRSAHVAAETLANAVRHGETDAINVLYLHGPAGSGKTCLVGAIVAAACDGTDRTACTLSGNDFPLPFAQPEDADRLKTARRADLLVVEDLHHLPARAVETLVQ